MFSWKNLAQWSDHMFTELMAQGLRSTGLVFLDAINLPIQQQMNDWHKAGVQYDEERDLQHDPPMPWLNVVGSSLTRCSLILITNGIQLWIVLYF